MAINAHPKTLSGVLRKNITAFLCLMHTSASDLGFSKFSCYQLAAPNKHKNKANPSDCFYIQTDQQMHIFNRRPWSASIIRKGVFLVQLRNLSSHILISSMKIISPVPSFWLFNLSCLSILTKYAMHIYPNDNKKDLI